MTFGPPHLGTLVFDEVILPIRTITLRENKIWVHASAIINATINERADMTMFAPDGTLVMRVPSMGLGSIHQSMGGGLMEVHLPISIDKITGRGE